MQNASQLAHAERLCCRALTRVQEVEVLELLLEREDKRLSEWRQAMDKIRSGVDGKS